MIFLRWVNHWVIRRVNFGSFHGRTLSILWHTCRFLKFYTFEIPETNRLNLLHSYKPACWLLLISLIAACSAPDYYVTNKKCYEAMLHENYTEALNALDKNRYLTAKHSRVLYRIEKARLLLLAKNYEEAFKNLESADLELDGWDLLKERDIMGAIRVSQRAQSGFMVSNVVYKPMRELLKSPRKVPYRPYPYERTMIHYYKAISLLQLNRYEDALIEARKLDELSHSYDDLAPVEPDARQYVSDAWPQLISGILYEVCNEPNHALIAYDNAFKKLTDPGVNAQYGIQMPAQLRTDLMRLSYRLRFDDRLNEYERLFETTYVRDTSLATCIVLVDNGLIPVKRNDRSWYHMRNGAIRKGKDKSKNSRTLSKPEFIHPKVKADPVVAVGTKQPEIVCNPAHITLKTLNKRYNYEADWYLQKYFKGDSVVSHSNERQDCDTRNWQFLPASVNYVKIAADTGLKTLLIQRQSGRIDTLQLYIRKGNNFCYIPR